MAKKFTIRKIHRYLSIFIAIQLLLWTVSGIYFAFNKIEMVRGEQYRLPLETEYRIFKRLGQEIIETNDNGVKTYSTHPGHRYTYFGIQGTKTENIYLTEI